jgi:hypothetical protein
MGFGGQHQAMNSIFNQMDGGAGGFTSVQTFSTGAMGGFGGGAPGSGMGMRSSSSSTRFVNGKKVTTKK